MTTVYRLSPAEALCLVNVCRLPYSPSEEKADAIIEQRNQEVDEAITACKKLAYNPSAVEELKRRRDTHDLGTRCTISGGEVMELGPQEGSEQIPF